jgi:hypothetical protein
MHKTVQKHFFFSHCPAAQELWDLSRTRTLSYKSFFHYISEISEKVLVFISQTNSEFQIF